jgi:hypothetical protein
MSSHLPQQQQLPQQTQAQIQQCGNTNGVQKIQMFTDPLIRPQCWRGYHRHILSLSLSLSLSFSTIIFDKFVTRLVIDRVHLVMALKCEYGVLALSNIQSLYR